MADSSARADGETRRDFLYLATGAVAGVGGIAAAWPLVDQMNPARDVLALASVEVDLAPIEEGQSITVMWRGKPLFVRRRTAAEIAAARETPLAKLKAPQADSERVRDGRAEWLVLVGVCTHLGCVPLGTAGDYGGWFCPCHGSHYDTSGRIRKGPAPDNLTVPEYVFLDDSRIRVG